MRHRIKDLPKSSRPMEKLELRGRESLSDQELLALILGTGDKKHNAVTVAGKLLGRHSLPDLTSSKIEDFAKVPGVGRMKAARIIAAFELGERAFRNNSVSKTIIENTEAALAQLHEITDKKQERIVGLYLNSRHELIHKETLAIGTLNSTLIEPRDILSPALSRPCSAIIIAHNHPSGTATPSSEDIEFTERIRQSCQIMGISLEDHLIVCTDDYFSFRENSFSRASKVSRKALR